jgi:hypothetical protein
MAQFLDPGSDIIREAISYMERSAYSKEQLDAYYQWKIDTITARSMLSSAEAIGLEKGEAIGLEKGEAITQKKMIANALNAGYSIEIISTLTGLEKEDILTLMEKDTE